MSKTYATWRERSLNIIIPIVESNQGVDTKILRRLISAAYPWPPRTNHPYKAWCAATNEVLKEYRHRDKVEHTLPWYSYVHFCTTCGYIITESEWEKATEQEVESYKAITLAVEKAYAKDKSPAKAPGKDKGRQGD